MKKSAFLLSFIIAAGLVSNNAMAKNFYRAKVRMKLTHSSAFDKTRTLKRTTAQLVISDDSGSYKASSFCQLKIENKVYKCQGKLSDSRNYYFGVDSETLKQILETNLGLSTSTVLGFKLDANYTFARSWSRYSGTDAKSSHQIHTDREDESYHLRTRSRKARKL